MELNQVSYFINLAETLNFTAAARLSGVSQPSLTRAIRRLEEELGGPLIYRDGKNSRLTALGQDVEMEFKRMQVALRNVRQHSDRSEEHTSELQSLMRISYAVFCLKKKKKYLHTS